MITPLTKQQLIDIQSTPGITTVHTRMGCKEIRAIFKNGILLTEQVFQDESALVSATDCQLGLTK